MLFNVDRKLIRSTKNTRWGFVGPKETHSPQMGTSRNLQTARPHRSAERSRQSVGRALIFENQSTRQRSLHLPGALGKTLSVQLDAFNLVQCLGSHIALPTVWTTDNGHILNGQQTLTLAVTAGDATHARALSPHPLDKSRFPRSFELFSQIMLLDGIRIPIINPKSLIAQFLKEPG